METAIKTEKDPGRSGFLTEAAPAGCFLFCVLAQTPRKRSFGFCQDVCRRHTPIARPSRQTRRAAAKPAPAAAAAVQTVGMAIERGSFSAGRCAMLMSANEPINRDLANIPIILKPVRLSYILKPYFFKNMLASRILYNCICVYCNHSQNVKRVL